MASPVYGIWGATSDPAVYLSLEDTHGSLEKGKMADMVMLDKNPVENIDNTLVIDEVIRAGKRIQRLYPSNNEPDRKF